MSKRFCHAMILSGVGLCCFFQPVRGWGQYPSDLDCTPLPETRPAGQVSVYVAKAQAKPGFLCVRVINRLSEPIYSRYPLGRLQQWESGWWWQPSQFRDYQPDLFVGTPDILYRLQPGQKSDENLPLSRQPAPAGRYRVCVRYQITLVGEEDKHEACSEEVTLP